jgi:hypothetical protein
MISRIKVRRRLLGANETFMRLVPAPVKGLRERDLFERETASGDLHP